MIVSTMPVVAVTGTPISPDGFYTLTRVFEVLPT